MLRIIAILLLIMLTSCRAGPPWQAWMYDGPPGAKKNPNKYHPTYVEGWQDGCHTGVSMTTNHWYKFFYTFKQDAIKAQNRIYYKGWKDAFDYCQRYIYMYERRSFL